LISTELADENTVKSIYGGLEGHYKKWSSRLKTALQTTKTDQCDCSNDNTSTTTTTCCKSLANGNHSVDEVRAKEEFNFNAFCFLFFVDK